MRLHRNQLGVRVAGTLTGLGFLVVGAYAAFGADGSVGDYARERSFWFGLTALVGGVLAIGMSWLDSDLTGVWCRSPRRPPPVTPESAPPP
jgi:hypothetical protein